MIKRVFPLPLLLPMLFFLSACDSGLKIVEVELEKYPLRIVYLQNIDTTLDLLGGRAIILTQDGGRHREYLSELPFTHNIDFEEPGVYEVSFATEHYEAFSFAVQVISADNAINYLAKMGVLTE